MKLLEAYQFGPYRLPSRVVMAPMTRNRSPETVPSDLVPTYYAQRAGAGLIITEATQVIPTGQGYPNTPGIHSQAQIDAWKKVTDAVHEAGGRIFLQLWHVGRISHSSIIGETPHAPSAIAPEGQVMNAEYQMVPYETPRALETDEIPALIDGYRQGAENAKAAGFDGVEVHGANGYLLDQFLQSGTNHRTDQYGGSLENRARLLLEITKVVCEVWGSDRVGVRLSPNGTFNDMQDDHPTETFTYVAKELNTLKLAYLHLVENQLDGRKATAVIREVWDGTLMAAGGFDRDSGEEAIQEGRLDLVAYARYYVSNPDLAARYAADADLAEWDQSTFYQGGPNGYTDYPTMVEAVSS
ncbi:MAG: alkene reductase [Bacteroidota bacterium]